MQVYKSASWTDSVPDLLQTTLLHTFEDSGKILSVSRPGGGIRGQYQLLTEVRAFESEYQDGQPHAVTEVYAKLIQTSSGKVVAARSFRESEPAAGTEVGTVVDAFSRSLGRLSSAIAGWTLTEGSRQAPEPAATKQR